ncbi:adenosylcobinamide-GDP ribazoletransferase [Pseudomonas turukhanskensis]|uniref:Adenosylcobinamide-GDP ribazoletransferase n=1 Tax=Pseudomonas turukhanskensis TaxID=1806536 RepID=A0A9W6NFL9_9PSED|nr:adenosylcobinamide-GDP ribazoletransferase [Pseudomonas turukhanskensis]GLK89844.1 adenosylcobinamide-GDP ribazoletransferase [Pseudomonas turukhanskensis]
MIPLLIAVQFLTSLPVRLPGMPSPQELGRSLLWYPLVGLLIGVLLYGLDALLSGTPLLLHAALLLAAWVALSGALHLDGLADSADAWLGGFGDRERTLTIMKDPRSGPIAVVTLVIVLLLKFAALVALIEQQHASVLLLAPWLARGLLPLLFMTTPYVRAGGLGQALAEHLPREYLPLVLGLHAVAMLLFGWAAVVLMVVGLVVFAWLRQRMIARLGGTTGDTAGAMVELVECGVVVVLSSGTF